MSSGGEQRKQNIPSGNCLQEEVVNPQGNAGVPSSHQARTGEHTRGARRYDLMEEVVGNQNAVHALSRVERNKGAAGIDGMAVKSLRPYLREHWPKLKEQLLQGTYKPMPVRRVEIPKPDGGKRQLGIPTALDRFIQQALMQVLTQIFDPCFSPNSYGFRPARSAHQAVTMAKGYITQGYKHVVDVDLEKFFDRVNHDILMERVARRIGDKRVLKLIRAYLNAGAMLNGCKVRTEEGTPQGGPLSPLLANILLDELDKELEKRGHRFVRYADDCNIYVRSKRAGERVMKSVTGFLENQLKLKVNVAKSAVDRPWRRKFLGFSFTRGGTQVRVAPKSLERYKDRIKELTKRSRSISLEERIERVNTYLRGWIGYFQKAETPSVLNKLDEWTRRRMRMCLLKQWKKPQTKRRKLVGLGISDEWARKISGSRKGYWRLANTPQVNKALGLAFWQDQGLISLTDTYKRLRQVS